MYNLLVDVPFLGFIMVGMATPKRKPGRPKGRTPTYTIHTGIDLTIGDALERYMIAQTYEPKLKQVIERSLKLLLEEEGFWPPAEGHRPKGGE